jgi:hypothetical protein
MKKKHRPRPIKRAHRPRNAATGLAPAAPRPRARTLGRNSTAPHWKTIAAAVAGGAGSAALGGLVVNQQILSPEAVGIGLMLGGGATAYFSEGTSRVVGTSVAAAGAGQFALAIMNKRAIKAHDDANKNPAPVASPAPATPQLAPPPAVAPRRSASGGGVVVDLFRDAASDLETIEDEWRYGVRDDGYGSAPQSSEPIVIDLDEAA